jgi:hypothetical protein
MDLRTVSSTWYEAVMVKGYGAKLDGQYNNKRDAAKAISNCIARVIERGYKPDEYFVMMCTCIRMIDSNGDVVSETIARVRV